MTAAVGGAYYTLVQRHEPSHVQAPEGELFAEAPPEAAPAASPL